MGGTQITAWEELDLNYDIQQFTGYWSLQVLCCKYENISTTQKQAACN